MNKEQAIAKLNEPVKWADALNGLLVAYKGGGADREVEEQFRAMAEAADQATKGKLFRCALYRDGTVDGDIFQSPTSKLVRATAHALAAITYLDVLKEAGADMPSSVFVWTLTEPEDGMNGYIYEPHQVYEIPVKDWCPAPFGT